MTRIGLSTQRKASKVYNPVPDYRHVRSSVLSTVASGPATGDVLMTSDGAADAEGREGWRSGRMLSRARSALALRNSAEAASVPPSSCNSSSSSERLELLRHGRLASPAQLVCLVSFSLPPDAYTKHRRTALYQLKGRSAEKRDP